MLEGDKKEVRTVTWSPTGEWLAAGGLAGTVRVWNADSGQLHRELRHVDPAVEVHSPVYALAWDPQGRWLAAGVHGWYRECIVIWDQQTWSELTRFADSMSGVSVAWSPDGNQLAMGNWRHDSRIWNSTTWEESATLFGHTGAVKSVAWSPDGASLALEGSAFRLSADERTVVFG